MKILLIGATGGIGSRILNEALSRGHEVTAVARDTQSIQKRDHLKIIQGDMTDLASMKKLAAGQDALVSSTSPRAKGGKEQYLATIRAALEVTKQAKIPYAFFVGGASSLEVEPGKTVLSTLLERIPKERLEEPMVVMEARDLVAASGVNWTFLSPAGQIAPGERTGKYRLGGMQPVKDAEGQSRISTEDYAVAVLDELERPAHSRRQFNIAY